MCYTYRIIDLGGQLIMAATEPIRDKKQLKALGDYFLKRGQLRNYTMIVMGACTVLRISDLLRLKWSDVYDEGRGVFYSHITVRERKTGKQKTIKLSKAALGALTELYPHWRGEFIFANNRKDAKAIGRVQAWRIIHEAVVTLGITGKIACHSLRKTWGYHACRGGAVPPAVIMHIYNHSSFEITKIYLGIEQDDIDAALCSVELF